MAWFEQLLQWVARGFELAGVAVIAFGALAASWESVAALARGRRRAPIYHGFRTRLARGILLGLEFLVAADIIGTVAVEPTLENLAVLGGIVLIRTFLSFALEVEIEGRWPWQKRERRPEV